MNVCVKVLLPGPGGSPMEGSAVFFVGRYFFPASSAIDRGGA